MQAQRLERDLRGLVAQRETIVAGPWLGEVGFELLYWVPFLRWFAERFRLAPDRLLVVSRGGTASWYRPFAAGYREIFDHVTVEEFRSAPRRARRGQRRAEADAGAGVRAPAAAAADRRRRAPHDAASVEHVSPVQPVLVGPPGRALGAPACVATRGWRRRRCPACRGPTAPYTAVKFYFNECFPSTPENRAFARGVVRDLARQGPVVSLTTGLRLDDHDGHEMQEAGVHLLPEHLDVRENLAVQTALVAGAPAFVGTYGGFSYLAPFAGVADDGLLLERGRLFAPAPADGAIGPGVHGRTGSAGRAAGARGHDPRPTTNDQRLTTTTTRHP